MKAVLVIDEMPKSCFECRYCGFLESNMKRRCCGLVAHLIYDFDIESGRHECCPLKPMPEYKAEEYSRVLDYSDGDFARGWNACLD